MSRLSLNTSANSSYRNPHAQTSDRAASLDSVDEDSLEEEQRDQKDINADNQYE